MSVAILFSAPYRKIAHEGLWANNVVLTQMFTAPVIAL